MVHRYLWGAVRLARFDPVGLAVYSDRDRDFWQSFVAALIVLPMFLFWIGLRGTGLPEDVPTWAALLYEMLSFACGWLIYPVVAYPLCRIYDRSDQYVRFIIVYNWASVVQNALFFLLNIPTAFGLLTSGARSVLGLAILIYVLMYGWFVVKTALGVTAQRAALFVAIDFITSLAWERFTDWLVGTH